MSKRGGDFGQEALDYRAEEIDFQTRTNALFRHNGVPILTGASNFSIQPFGNVPNASGVSLVGTDFTLQPASDVLPGGVTAGPQAFGGEKEFVDDIKLDAAVSMTGLAIAPTLASQVLLIEPTGEVSRTIIPTISPVGTVPNAAGCSVDFVQFQLQPADATRPGVVTAGAQAFGGPKSFPGGVSGSNLSGVNTGDVTFTPFGAAPSASGVSQVGQVVTLQPADATRPGGITAGAQTFGGAKIFASTISAANLSGSNTGDVSIGPVSGVSFPDGATMVGQTISLAPASTTTAGILTAGPQNIGGSKSFAANISALNLSGSNTGDIFLTPVGAAPNANGASLVGQVLSLQPASSTQPGVVNAIPQTFGGVKTFTDDIVPAANIVWPLASTATAGGITKNGARFLCSPGTNVFMGTQAGSFTAGVTDCTFIGHQAGSNVGAGCDNNTGCGLRSLTNITAGAVDNTCFGENSGANYTGSESRNCCIASPGVLGDNNQIRIGNTFHTNCTVRGVSGVVVPGGATVLCNATGLFGTVVSSRKRKREIEDIPSQDMAKFWQLEPKRFKMNGDDTDEQHYGVIAEQADEIKLSSLVTKNEKDEIDNFQYFKLDGFYIKALQDIKAELQLQKAEIEALKANPQ